jgi:hypothetical protein
MKAVVVAVWVLSWVEVVRMARRQGRSPVWALMAGILFGWLAVPLYWWLDGRMEIKRLASALRGPRK